MALGFYNPLQRLLDGPLNVSGQPERTPEGGINRPSPVYNRPPPQETFQNPFAPTAPAPSSGRYLPEITFKSDLPQVTGFQSEAPATAGPATLGNPFDFASVMGENTVPKMPAEMYLRGGDDRFMPMASSGDISITGRPSVDNRGKFIDNVTGEVVSRIDQEMPYAATVDQVTRGLDPVTQQLLFGLDGEGGFIPGAMRAAERTFFDDEGNPVVIPEQVADFTQDQLDAFQLARSGVGSEGRFLSDAEAAYRSGIGSLTSGLERGLGVTEGATERLMEDLSGVEDIMRGTTRGYDPSMTEQFYNPYEDRVVQQTISDVLDAGDRADMAQTARDIATGGESAFGSRARLTAEERREALGRGLGEALGGIRSRGFTEAQRTGLGEFGRQLASERAAASGLAGLARSGYGAGTALGNLYGNIGQQQMLGQSRLGSALSGLGRQAQTARFGDIQSLLGGGNLQQQLAQQQLQASRANALQAQTAPLLQYQSLLPFIQTVPTGAMQTNIGFQPTPSPLQAGLGVGLSALGALGNFMNPNAYYSPANPY